MDLQNIQGSIHLFSWYQSHIKLTQIFFFSSLSISFYYYYYLFYFMASSSAPSFTLPNIMHMVQVKVEGPNNYMSWLSQIVPLLKSHELMGIVDGSETSPPPFVIDPTNKE
jgi:hypothetical protein